LIADLQTSLRSPEVIEHYRVNEKQWTRQRELSFEKVAVLILQGHRCCLQTNLNRFYQAMGELPDMPSSSAYCQARQKLSPELFIHLNDQATEHFYRAEAEEPPLASWKGHRLVGADGSVVNLPDTPETRRHYTVQQTPAGERVQALGCALYDVIHQVGLRVDLSRKRAEKHFLFETALSVTRPGDLLLMDRGYADYAVMAFCRKHQRDFLIRMPAQSFSRVNAFRRSEATDQVVELKLPDKQKRWVRQQQLAETLRVRLIKVVLDSGEVEVLATSLLDGQLYPAEDFKPLYAQRWGIETYWGRLKNLLEVERFSGYSLRAIQQDFYGMAFLATLQSVLAHSDQEQLRQASQPHRYAQQVNHSVGYSALLDSVVALLMDPERNSEQTLEALHHLFQTSPTLQRPGRKYPRKQLRASQKLWYCRYTKRVAG
jgi:hypothetical protein